MMVGWLAEFGKGTQPTQWIQGEPKPSMWTGTRIPKDSMFEVSTYGCQDCGFLESYVKR